VIRFMDLKAQYQSIKSEIDTAVLKVLESGAYVLGTEVEAFEREFAEYCGTTEAIAVNSGTSALHLALLSLGVGAGDEVITTPFTFVATIAAIEYTGARPVLVDIDPRTFTIDPAQIAAAVTSKTKAIVPVHLHGQPSDMRPLLLIADSHGIPVIEDAAQAHGADYEGSKVGSLGELGCFSFYPAKNLGAYGEGGIVTTRNPQLAQTVRAARDWGQVGKSNHAAKGHNYRMDAIQGAVLRVKLASLDAWNSARRERAGWYRELLKDSGLGIPREASYGTHVYHVFAVRSAERDALRQSLADKGIETGIHYRDPVHLLPAYSDLGYSLGDFPNAECAASEVLSLPLYPELSREQVEFVAAAIREA
jgi:dTDP-4-amino-4,6-dideoxygalactose transaminase